MNHCFISVQQQASELFMHATCIELRMLLAVEILVTDESRLDKSQQVLYRFQSGRRWCICPFKVFTTSAGASRFEFYAYRV